MNVALGVEGAGDLIPALGKEWSLTPPTLDTEAAFEAWMVMVEQRKLLARAPLMTPAEFRRNERRLTAAEIRGDFEFWGETFFDVSSSPRGAARLFYLLLRQKHPDLTPELAEEIYAAAPQLSAWALQSAMHKARPDLFTEPGARPGEGASEADAPASNGPGAPAGAGESAASPAAA